MPVSIGICAQRKSPALRHGALAIDPTSMRCPGPPVGGALGSWMNPYKLYTIYSYATMRTRLLISKQGGEVVVGVCVVRSRRSTCCSAMPARPLPQQAPIAHATYYSAQPQLRLPGTCSSPAVTLNCNRARTAGDHYHYIEYRMRAAWSVHWTSHT